MTEIAAQNPAGGSVAHNSTNAESEFESENQAGGKLPRDPVRRWTFIILAVCIVLLAWYLRADRVTPYTSLCSETR